MQSDAVPRVPIRPATTAPERAVSKEAQVCHVRHAAVGTGFLQRVHLRQPGYSFLPSVSRLLGVTIIADTIQLHTWTRSLGPDAVVEEQESLRSQLKGECEELAGFYGATNLTPPPTP